jgi:hypothetical protein
MTTHPSEPAFVLTERLGVEWQGHPVAFLPDPKHRLPAGTAIYLRNLTLDQRIAGQVDSDGRVWFLADLPAYARHAFTLEPGRNETGGARVETDPVAREYRLTNGLISLAVPQVHREAAHGSALTARSSPKSAWSTALPTAATTASLGVCTPTHRWSWRRKPRPSTGQGIGPSTCIPNSPQPWPRSAGARKATGLSTITRTSISAAISSVITGTCTRTSRRSHSFTAPRPEPQAMPSGSSPSTAPTGRSCPATSSLSMSNRPVPPCSTVSL